MKGIVLPTLPAGLSEEEKIAVIKKKFEELYGKDQQSRTQKQWRSLVDVYGMSEVMKREKMSEKAIRKRMKGK